ncbi:MAG: glycosyltransferase family 4 protein [Pseudomonadota bacterium]
MISRHQKTCIVVICFDENQPGYLDFSYRIAALSKAYQLTVISHGEITQPELLFDNVRYNTLDRRNGKLGWMRYIVKCAIFIRQQKPDVVVLLHSAMAPIALLVRKIPTCLYWNEHPTNLMHMPVQFAPIRKLVTHLLHQFIFFGAKKSTLVMPIGEDHQEDLAKHGVLIQKIRMIYMGVSADFLPANLRVEHNQASHNDSIIRLIYVGTVSESRGRDVMLDAMKLIADKQLKLHLTIVGANADELIYCRQRISALSLQRYITVIGKVSGSEVPSYLAQADVAICLWQASQWNQFNPPTKLFEYLVAGLPVLASNIRTHTRYVHDGYNGFVFEYTAQLLACALENLQGKNDAIPAMQQHALHSGQQYLWPKLEPIFLTAINEAATT